MHVRVRPPLLAALYGRGRPPPVRVYPVVWGYLKEDTVSTLQTVVQWAIYRLKHGLSSSSLSHYLHFPCFSSLPSNR